MLSAEAAATTHGAPIAEQWVGAVFSVNKLMLLPRPRHITSIIIEEEYDLPYLLF